MKIISWNCNMAFRKKYEQIIRLKPDILIVIECESKEKLSAHLKEAQYHQIVWMGDNIHKGIAIITFTDIEISLQSCYNDEFRYVIPFTIHSTLSINMIVIWAMPHESIRSRSYVGQIWAAINYYDQLLKEPSILIGDFNSNSIWDKTRKNGNHNDVVHFLKNYNIVSLYHAQNDEEHGKESQPTQYMYRHLDKPYHLDYCFASIDLINSENHIEIGQPDHWISMSDHMPIIVDLDI